MLVVRSETRDIYRNLALEERLLDAAVPEPVLLLYINAPSVVIGRNQNPWRECRLSRMKEKGVMLARRISGGGAVYHDEGNLNVAVIVPRAEYVEERQYDLVFNALEPFGIQASRMGPNSLAVNGRKFSGQAFCHRKTHTLHHGTLLVNSNLERLGCCLGTEVDAIRTKAIASVPAPVINLEEASPGVTTENLIEKLVDTFQEMYRRDGDVDFRSDCDFTGPELSELEEKAASEPWLFEKTPPFEVMRDGRLLEVRKGRVVNVSGAPLFSGT